MARKSRKNITADNCISAIEYIRTAQYIRLSVEDSNHKGNSIDNQKLILDDYIARNVNMKLTETYIDNGATGRNFDRPAFQHMLEDIENGKIDCAVVKDLSRLGRNAIDTGFYIEKYFASKNIRFIAVSDNFDTANTEANGLLMPLKNIINEAYSIDIGKKVKSQARQAMQSGEYVAARPRYGYLKDENNCHKLVIDKETAPVVKQAFEWFVGGMSLNEICLQLNQRNIPTPSVYEYEKGIITTKKSVGNGYWQTRTISRMLTEPLYTGNMVQGKTETIGKVQKRITDKSKWITVKNTHEAIVSEELFERVQNRLDELKNKAKNTSVNPYTENIYKGKVFCGTCGKPMHRSREIRKKTADIYRFRCLSNTRVARGSCDTPQITEDELTRIVISAIKAQKDAIVGKKKLLHSCITDKHQILRTETDIFVYKRYIERNQDFLRSLYENLVNRIITQEEYSIMKSDYEMKISEAVKKIHTLENETQQQKIEYEKYCDLSDTVSAICKNNRLTAALIDKLIDRIDIYKNKSLSIQFSFKNEFCEVNANA